MRYCIAILLGAILLSGIPAHSQAPDVHRIPFSSIQGVSVGNAQDPAAGTGVTVFRFTVPGIAAVDVFGGGPASRETETISPQRNHPLNALVFSGGSAYGLAASGGVANCLEKHGIGYETGSALVPLICQSCIYDLGYGSASVRPDEQMGYAACEASFIANNPQSGNVGAGTGATVGKAGGLKQAQKSGIGYAAAQLGTLQIGVAVVVNSYGDVYADGQKIAGMRTPDRSAFADSYEALLRVAEENLFTATTNTSLVAVFTNGRFTPAQLKQLAQMTSAGLARSINPIFTTADGDTVYAVSIGPEDEKINATLSAAGALSAQLLQEAITNAILSSQVSEQEFLKMVQ